MCTDRQRLYLRDLGVDPTAPLDGLPKDVASEWIGELKELVSRASLPIGQPLTSAVVTAVGGREEALHTPPRTLSAVVPRPSANPNEDSGAGSSTPTQSLADESWWKLELQATVTVGEGRTMTVSVGGSEHRRRPLSNEDVDALACACAVPSTGRSNASGATAAGLASVRPEPALHAERDVRGRPLADGRGRRVGGRTLPRCSPPRPRGPSTTLRRSTSAAPAKSSGIPVRRSGSSSRSGRR